MSWDVPQLCSAMTHLTLCWRWSLWMPTMRWKCLDRVFGERRNRTPLCLNTLQERLSGEPMTLSLSEDVLVVCRLPPLGSTAGTSCDSSHCCWVAPGLSPARLSPGWSGWLWAVQCSDQSVMTGGGLAGLMGSRQPTAEGNQGVKTGVGRHWKASSSSSVRSTSTLTPATDPGR